MTTLHVGSGSSSDAPFATGSQSPRKVNESVYKFDRPLGTPTLQILFFHGLQFDDSSNPHFRNWESRDRSVIWPEEWLVEDFPTAEILYISYDGFVKRRSHLKTSPDMYITGENLMSDLIQAGVGQIWNCPVIMVGHCFGGMVIKQLCLQAHKQLTNPTTLKMFLDNVKGIYYYSTPHHGSDIFEKVGDKQHPLWSFVRVLNKDPARLNHEFDNLSKLRRWQIRGIGARLPVQSGRFKGLVVVEEASARGGECFAFREADHFGICKPEGKASSGYYELENLVRSIQCSIPKAAGLLDELPTHPTGLRKRSHEVEVKVAHARVLGIVGMGGIGKTTIAKEVFNNISRNFEFACFAENVKGKKDQLKDQLLENCYRRGTKVHRNLIQWSDLQKTNTLLVVDDVHHTQIKRLSNLDFFGEGSRLIITSRDQGVLDVFPTFDIYDVDFLIDDEAKQLFCRNAFGEDEIPDHLIQENHSLKKNVDGVVRKCGGLPLTLEVTGCYLRRHETNAEVWEETIVKLGNAESVYGRRDDEVWPSLKVSYDGLDSDLQGMFIEAATYFFGQRVVQALAAWSTAYGNSLTAWDRLLSTSMVKESACSRVYEVDDDRREIWVHEHLRDLAKSLSKGWTVSLFSERGVRMNLLNVVKPETKHLRILEPDCQWNYHPRELTTLPLEILDKLEELKYLDLQNVAPEGSSMKFPKNLSLLIWSFPLVEKRFAPFSLRGMNNLAVLKLSWCRVPEEFIGALGTLTELRILSLGCIEGLSRLPENLDDLSKLNCLELSVLKIMELPQSIGHLRALKHLNFYRLNLKELPESLGNLSSLATLQIGYCKRLRSLPESFGRLTSLTKFSMGCCGMLEFLQLSESPGDNCRRGELADSFGSLSSLKYLRLEDLPRLESLPPSFGMLSSLEELELYELEQQDTLPENFGELKALQILVIRNTKRLEALPKSIGLLHSLRTLRIVRSSLSSIPEELVNLPSLEILWLVSCNRIETLPDGLGRISSLRRVILENCERLKNAPDSWGEDLAPREDGSIETRKTEPERSSHKASAERIRLCVDNCPFLGDSELRTLGWIETDWAEWESKDVYFGKFRVTAGDCYRRSRRGEGIASTSPILNNALLPAVPCETPAECLSGQQARFEPGPDLSLGPVKSRRTSQLAGLALVLFLFLFFFVF